MLIFIKLMRKNGINLKFYNGIFPNPENLLKHITKNSERISVNSDQSIIIKKICQIKMKELD